MRCSEVLKITSLPVGGLRLIRRTDGRSVASRSIVGEEDVPPRR